MPIEQMTRPELRATASPNTGIKTILVHVQDGESATRRIEEALNLARSSSAHLAILHVTPIEAYVAFDSFGGVFVMNDVIEAIDDETVRLRAQIEADLRREDVSWDYDQVTGNVAAELAGRGALADLIVTGREPPINAPRGQALSFLGDLLQVSRTPLLITAEQSVDPTGGAVIAWDGSFEAANAVRSSVGLLKMASSVRAVFVTDDEAQPGMLPGTRLLEYLSRHGIHAELVVERQAAGSDDGFIAASLVGHARSIGGYVVMGGYGRSRLSEFLFGGVTRTMLRDANVPLVVAR
jgi:nucleotide-binding universal stress UspA family protein